MLGSVRSAKYTTELDAGVTDEECNSVAHVGNGMESVALLDGFCVALRKLPYVSSGYRTSS